MICKMNKHKITWIELFDTCAALALKVVNHEGGFNDIVAIARGGLLPAHFLAYKFDIRRIHSVGISYYNGEEKMKHPIIYQPLAADFSFSKVLLIDEIVDSGDTFHFVKNELINRGCGDIITASLYYKPCSKFKPDYFGKEVDAKEWITFPYDE